jgi:hypothetical protein
MKPTIRSSLTIVAVASFNLVNGDARSQTVDIPDAALAAAIRQTLNKPTGDLTARDMESLTILDASAQTRGWGAPAIGSLEGLQNARHLT